MLSEKLAEAMNSQINAEMWSAYLYLSMSMDAENKAYKGIANWFYIQYQEEVAHARIMMNYLNSRDVKVDLRPIAEVPTTWKDPMDMFTSTLEHERKVTSLINNLYVIADEVKDFATISMLRWFIDEQVEEEANVKELIDSLNKVGDNKMGLYMVDKEMATRVFNQPALLAGK